MRAALFAAVCLALSAAGHWWMSGQGVPVHALVMAYAAVVALTLALTGKERSFCGIAAAVLLSELGLHLYFSSAQAATGTISMSMAMGSSHNMAGMSMAGMSSSMPMGSTGGMAPMGHGLWGMLAVHVAAGLVSAWWLRWGEASVFAVLRVVATTAVESVLRIALSLLRLAFGTWMPVAPVRRARDAWLIPQPGRCALLDVVVRRGPPTVAFVV